MSTLLLVLNLLLTIAALGAIALLFRKLQFLTRVALNSQQRQRTFIEDTFPESCDSREKADIISAVTHARISAMAQLDPVELTAQFGEDLILNRFFDDMEGGVFFEAGAYDGKCFSNTYMLAKMGWTGLLVEPHPVMVEKCRKNRAESIIEHCALSDKEDAGSITFTQADDEIGGAALSFVEADEEHLEFCKSHGVKLKEVEVPCRTLNSLLEGRFDRVDFFSLDVEGMEMSVLRGFDIARYQPQIFLIEMKEEAHNQEVTNYLKNHGYEPLGKRGCNVFFVHQSRAKKFNGCISERDRF